ncbi:MAG TPA: hypothetical protein VFZ89_13085 [Solirubrobacteraceae bacterium]
MGVKVFGRSAPEELEGRPSGRFLLRERSVAYWTMGIAAVAIAGLVVSVSTRHAQKLETVALILAVVAFCLQIGFFVVQLWVAREQDRRSNELYAETAAVLTQIDARSAETVAVIKEQFRFVLEHALDGRQVAPQFRKESTPGGDVAHDVEVVADQVVQNDHQSRAADDAAAESSPSATASDPDPGAAELNAQVGELLAELQKQQAQRTIQRWEDIARPSSPSIVTQARERALKRKFDPWPDEEDGIAALDALDSVSDGANELFSRFSQTMARLAREGKSPPGMVRADTGDEPAQAAELVKAGLITEAFSRDENGRVRPFIALTDLGLAAARTITARGRLPQWYVTKAGIDAGSGATD